MRNRAVVPMTLAVFLLISTLFYGVLDVFDVVPGILTTSPSAKASPIPEANFTDQIQPLSEIGKYEGAQALDKAKINAAISEFVGDESTKRAVLVEDAYSGEVVASYNPNTPLIPASNMKLLSGINALENLGPTFRFKTSTFLSGDTVYLKAGGDLLLSPGESDPQKIDGHAGIATLAKNTAEALKQAGVNSVHVRYDLGIWTSDVYHPDWVSQGDITFVGEVAPMAFDRGRYRPDEYRYKTQVAQEVATTFAQRLGEDGISLIDGPAAAETPSDSRELSHVDSAPLTDIVHFLFKASDNTLTEALCRAVAVQKHQSTSLVDAPHLMRQDIADLGINTEGFDPHDCSGLSRQNRVSPATLTSAWNYILNTPNNKSRGILSDMPVAGFDGTLHDRFKDLPDSGRVMGKTGTVDYVRSLSGFIVTDSGHLLIFAILDNATTQPEGIDKLVEEITHS